MLTRSKKKRMIVGKDVQSSSKNSDEKDSTVPRNDVVEVGEMVTLDHGVTIGGLDDACQRTNYLQVAWLLREKLSDLVDNDKGEFPESGLRSLLDMATSHSIISVDPKMLNPVLWRTLPRELLLLVLARLPVPDIIRLRRLSKEWRRDMFTANSDINQACDEACPIMVASVSSKVVMYEGLPHSGFRVKMCDLSTHRSRYSFSMHPRIPINPTIDGQWKSWSDMGARDGGLVCFVSTWRPTEANPLRIFVVNFLAQLKRKLPPLQYVYSTPPQMMHIKVDSKTKCYRVVVIGKSIKGRPTVEIYDSCTRRWTKATPPCGFIFGLSVNWMYDNVHKAFKSTNSTRSVYDFVEGQVKSCDEKDPALVMTFRKDYKFVLHKIPSNGEMLVAKGHCITKYHSKNNAKDWVYERSYLCSPFEDLLEKNFGSVFLKACEGFLMVFPLYSSSHRHFWLLDLATGEWSSHPKCFEGKDYKFMIERAFWNVIP